VIEVTGPLTYVVEGQVPKKISGASLNSLFGRSKVCVHIHVHTRLIHACMHARIHTCLTHAHNVSLSRTNTNTLALSPRDTHTASFLSLSLSHTHAPQVSRINGSFVTDIDWVAQIAALRAIFAAKKEALTNSSEAAAFVRELSLLIHSATAAQVCFMSLYVYVGVGVCVYVGVGVYVYGGVGVCGGLCLLQSLCVYAFLMDVLHTTVHVCECAYMCVCVCMWVLCICVCVCLCLCVFVCVCVCVCGTYDCEQSPEPQIPHIRVCGYVCMGGGGAGRGLVQVYSSV